jgi:dUTP pyrophosphatase
MKKEVNEKLEALFAYDTNDTLDQLLSLLELPDEQFDALYPSIQQKLDLVFASEEFQQDTLKAIKLTGHGSIEEERAAALEVIDEIAADDTLSRSKRDFLTSLIEGSVVSIINLIEVPRERVKVQIKKLSEDAVIPQYAHKTDAGADVYAIEDVTLKPHETQLIKTGISVAIPVGYEIQVRPRSGLSLKTGLRVANAPGTIDSDYRGEVCVIMTNTDNLSQTINKGDKIAQLVISAVPMIDWVEVDELDSTERGEGGFGSTDKK